MLKRIFLLSGHSQHADKSEIHLKPVCHIDRALRYIKQEPSVMKLYYLLMFLLTSLHIM